ncbi:MAG: hypothetical protein GXO12_04065 [Epsilonproteobacteria bacterium]|nr:hypothetical protein [Campylobacterota bacterium]
MFLILELLKAIYFPKRFIVGDNFLEVDGVKYDLDEIYYKYVPTGVGSTLLAAKLYLKKTNKEIGLLIFSFWGGSILNITPETFEKIFKNRASITEEIEEQNISFVDSVDIEEEEREIKRFDTAWYIVYGVFIPVVLILYLATKG